VTCDSKNIVATAIVLNPKGSVCRARNLAEILAEVFGMNDQSDLVDPAGGYAEFHGRWAATIYLAACSCLVSTARVS
jgi:hypothetical protein